MNIYSFHFKYVIPTWENIDRDIKVYGKKI